MTSSVRAQSSAVLGMAEHWPMLRVLLGGTKSMRDAGEQFLPKWPNEDAESYKARLKVATLYPAFSRTVEVMASKPFAKALTLSGNAPESIRVWCEDVDLQGRNLHSFASEIMRDCIGYGISGVLIDYPTADNIKTREDERKAGLRPYFVHYKPGTVLGWRSERINGVETLIQLRLLETVSESDGEFGEKEIEQVRVLVPGAWATYRRQENVKEADQWILHEEGTRTLYPIPFVFFYGERTGFGTGKAPLLELAHLNVEHWQSTSDQQTITHVARVPILTVIGADNDTTITVGASTAVKLPVGSTMSFVEHSGAAIEAGRTSILDLEERMRQIGAQLIVLQPGKVTATQVQSDDEGNKCALHRIAENLEDAMDRCLEFMAQWVGEMEAGSVELFKDFGAASLSDASAQLLLTSATGGMISKQTLINEYKRRGILSAEIDYETEKDMIDEQGAPLGMTNANGQ